MSADVVDPRRRRFLTGAVGVVGGAGTALAAWPFLSAWQPSERAKAIGAPIEIDISKIEPGQRLVEKWRGKPVWVIQRPPEVLEALSSLDDKMRDPQSEKDQQPGYAQNPYRSIRPELLVLVGICTHLGCAPLYYRAKDAHPLGPEWKGGFFCPCHGSRFDLAGRVFQGVPAPLNLEVPPHFFISDTRIRIGQDEGRA
jgi:ubiquinol-cytochrome c reductase iron-sulfur subunit